MTAVKTRRRYSHLFKFASGHVGILVHDGRRLFDCFATIEKWMDAGWCTADEAAECVAQVERLCRAIRWTEKLWLTIGENDAN